MMDAFIDSMSPILTQLSIGSVMGYATGKALQTAGNMLAIFVGTSFMILQGLAYKGWVSINWSSAISDSKLMLDMDGDGDFDSDDLKLIAQKFIEVCTTNLPSGGGFTAGLLLGLGFGGTTAAGTAAVVGTASIVPRALMIGAGTTAVPGIGVSMSEEYERWKERASGAISSVKSAVSDPVDAFKGTIKNYGLAKLREVEAAKKAELKAATDDAQRQFFTKMLDLVEEAKKAAKKDGRA